MNKYMYSLPLVLVDPDNNQLTSHTSVQLLSSQDETNQRRYTFSDWQHISVADNVHVGLFCVRYDEKY